jgi:hypothetical protein
MRTTVNYVLNSITEPFNARVIQKAQEQMFQRITVIPTSRSKGAKSLGLPKTQTQKIIDGRYDTGCGTCRNPYDSPQAGEEKDRAPVLLFMPVLLVRTDCGSWKICLLSLPRGTDSCRCNRG